MATELERLRRTLLVNVIEPARRRHGLSLREAARRAGMSEASWRQLVRGVYADKITRRWPARHQVLDMAIAVGELEATAATLMATPEEIQAAHHRAALIPDEAENELMNMRHLTPTEKVTLLRALRDMREEERTTT